MPNITRNAIVNCAELVTYDLIKEAILTRQLMTGEAYCVWTLEPAISTVSTGQDVFFHCQCSCQQCQYIIPIYSDTEV